MTHLSKRKIKASHILLIDALLAGLSLSAPAQQAVRAAAPGLPFTEDFADRGLRDSSLTNANWSTEEQALVLAWRQARYGAFGPESTGSNITADAYDTQSVALGDVDGDGDLDLAAGNDSQVNRLYLSNGTADPFNGVSGSDVTIDEHDTWAMALGDVDGDGDLDLVAGNWGQANRLYRGLLYHTGHGSAGSLRVDAEIENIDVHLSHHRNRPALEGRAALPLAGLHAAHRPDRDHRPLCCLPAAGAEVGLP